VAPASLDRTAVLSTDSPAVPGILNIIRRTLRVWLAGDTVHWGAALAYYALASLAPLLLLLVGVAGRALDAPTAGPTIVRQLQPFIGSRGATVAETILREGSFPGFGSFKAIASVALLLVAGTAVFANLRAALNAIWGVKPARAGWRLALRTRLMAFLMILIVGSLVTASVGLSAVIAMLSPLAETWVPQWSFLIRLLDGAVSTVVLWLAFAAIFCILPDAQVALRDALVGALATALLFVIGKTLVGLYLSGSDIGSPYGAAGSIFVFLIWLYYSAQIFLLGATFTAIWAGARGCETGPGAGP
jgi:membrane protein